MTAIDQFAQLISTAPREHDSLAIGRSRAAFIDTLACMFAGSSRPVEQKALAALDELWAMLSSIEQVGDLRQCLEFWALRGILNMSVFRRDKVLPERLLVSLAGCPF